MVVRTYKWSVNAKRKNNVLLRKMMLSSVLNRVNGYYPRFELQVSVIIIGSATCAHVSKSVGNQWALPSETRKIRPPCRRGVWKRVTNTFPFSRASRIFRHPSEPKITLSRRNINKLATPIVTRVPLSAVFECSLWHRTRIWIARTRGAAQTKRACIARVYGRSQMQMPELDKLRIYNFSKID